METPIVKSKPRIRPTAVRDDLNRYLLVAALSPKQKKVATRLMRLASISRAQLASVRRSFPRMRFKVLGADCSMMVDLGLGELNPPFPLSAKQMSAIGRLLSLPVYLSLNASGERQKPVDWEALKQIRESPLCLLVNGLDMWTFPPSAAFSEFIAAVAPQIEEMSTHSPVLVHMPPLDVDKLFYITGYVDYEVLSRHKVRCLDVSMRDMGHRNPGDGVLSASIKALGLEMDPDLSRFPCDSIDRFCRRFPVLEELHEDDYYVEDYFTFLWGECLKLRNRLNVPGLKRLFFKVTSEGICSFPFLHDWMEPLKQTKPFDQAIFRVDSFNFRLRQRMLLKLDWPNEALPTFFHFEADFRWEKEAATALDSSDDDTATGGAADGEESAMEQDEELEEDEAEEDEETDEDGMDDAGVY
ncbi:hypothetical protein M3Y99_01049100 [Aphelenchoides fujianensis]|nr:hypothetical protein M3Y99_01049100 [Aphelenchoides fujianensis]